MNRIAKIDLTGIDHALARREREAYRHTGCMEPRRGVLATSTYWPEHPSIGLTVTHPTYRNGLTYLTEKEVRALTEGERP